MTPYNLQLACPQCQCGLHQNEDELICASCGRQGTYIDGIPCFGDPEYYWGELPKERMQEVNRVAKESGWEASVERLFPTDALKAYVRDVRRADFQHIWDLPRRARVVDIGAGLGAIATSLGRNFSHVVAVEGVLERCRFIDTRARQSKLPVQVICADFLHLPLPAGEFDAVVLNGVLEWAAMAAPGHPREVQLRFLRSVRKLLKPNGLLYVGIENRIGWDMLRGAIDHSGLPYTSLMPRAIASLYCRTRAKNYRSSANVSYRTYTYSLSGYRKLFRAAGFSDIRAFHAWDGYNAPSVLLPLETPGPLLNFIESSHVGRNGLRGRVKDLALRVAARSGLWAQLASDFAFTARNT